MSASPAQSQIRFPRLSPEAFQHYDDVRATRALQRLPVFVGAMKFMSEKLLEKVAHMHHLSHCIRLGREQGAEVHKKLAEAAQILAVRLPELYISPESTVNAYAFGMKHHTIVLTRGLVESMNSSEILAVLGHELGHIKCEHMVNETVATLISQFGAASLADKIPALGPAAMVVLQAHLMDWSRKAELTCDRAALLVVQDTKVMASVLAKLAGWPSSLGTINFQSLVDQARAYDALDNESVGAALKLWEQLQAAVYLTHPLPINRVQAILQWAESDQYRAILDGQYPQIEGGETLEPLCAACGAAREPGDACCSQCGKKYEDIVTAGRFCAKCDFRLRSADVKFCGGCGRDLSKPGAILER